MAYRKPLEIVGEDTIQCFFYPILPNPDNLKCLCESLNKTIQELSAGYLWHKDEFKLHVPLKYGNDLPFHLASVVCFGDNIDDEWFIIYLILEITKQYLDLVVQVYDNDGEFLLIEAANSLPSWANPDSTENRVFIYQNSIHLIPPTVADISSGLRVADAIKFVTDMSKQTQSSEIKCAILKRIGDYPNKINENNYRAVAHLPANIATLLTIKPSLISPIVSAYCNHDAVDAKALKNLKFQDCVTTEIKFTKCLYAMLIHSQLTKNVKHVRIGENDKKSILGLKLTCGYELIMQKSSQDVFCSKEFNRFLKSLSVNGYFKDNIEGSQDYKQLFEQAKKFFLDMGSPINSQVFNEITQLMQTKEFIELRESVSTSNKKNVEDNDDWLNIDPDQLNYMLNSHYGRKTKLKNDDIINSHTITTELSEFLKQTSSLEGVETSKDDGECNNIEFDSEEFITTLNKMMTFMLTGNKDDIDSDSSDFMEDDTNLESNNDQDEEITATFYTDDDHTGIQNSKTIVKNMRQSLKEEKGSAGPISNILRTIGINKTDLLDSDDDEL